MFLSRRLLAVLFVLYIFGLFFQLGKMYFQHEEPRRAIIALEMNYNHNYIEPTVLGRPYFKKPPLHNIVIAAFFKLFGSNEFSARLVSVLSLILFALIIFFVLKDIVGTDASIFGSFSFLSAFVTYFSYGRLAETDMFFSLLVFCSMISIFIFRKYGIIIGSIFAALALLTKGFPALHYFYFSLLAYGFMEKKLKKMSFLRDSALGSLIIFGLFGLWILSFSHGNIHRINYALGFLISESGHRVLSIEKISASFVHAIIFPIKFWYHFLPFSFLLFIFFKKTFRDEFIILLKSNKKIKSLAVFSALSFIPNFMVYDLIPDGRVRYTLVLFGFAAFFMGIIFYELEYVDIEWDINKVGVGVFLLIFFISLLGAFFDYKFTNTFDYITCLFVAAVSVLFAYDTKRIQYKQDSLLFIFAGFAVLTKILFIAVYFSYLFTYYTNYRHYGSEIAGIVLKNNPEYVMSDAVNLRLFFYVERDLKMPIHPISKNREGIVISKYKNRVKHILYEVDMPKSVYYIGRNGGV